MRPRVFCVRNCFVLFCIVLSCACWIPCAHAFIWIVWTQKKNRFHHNEFAIKRPGFTIHHALVVQCQGTTPFFQLHSYLSILALVRYCAVIIVLLCRDLLHHPVLHSVVPAHCFALFRIVVVRCFAVCPIVFCFQLFFFCPRNCKALCRITCFHRKGPEVRFGHAHSFVLAAHRFLSKRKNRGQR